MRPLPGMFELESRWEIPAPPARVWRALIDVQAWPLWWPGLERATVIRTGPGGAERLHLVVRSDLGYRLRFGVEILGAEAPTRATARVVGDLRGTGSWTVAEAPGTGGRATSALVQWNVAPRRRLLAWPLRAIPPLSGPMAWAHGRMMRAGEAGLRAHIAGGAGL